MSKFMNPTDVVNLCGHIRTCCEDLLISGLAFMDLNIDNSKITDIH